MDTSRIERKTVNIVNRSSTNLMPPLQQPSNFLSPQMQQQQQLIKPIPPFLVPPVSLSAPQLPGQQQIPQPVFYVATPNPQPFYNNPNFVFNPLMPYAFPQQYVYYQTPNPFQLTPRPSTFFPLNQPTPLPLPAPSMSNNSSVNNSLTNLNTNRGNDQTQKSPKQLVMSPAKSTPKPVLPPSPPSKEPTVLYRYQKPITVENLKLPSDKYKDLIYKSPVNRKQHQQQQPPLIEEIIPELKEIDEVATLPALLTNRSDLLSTTRQPILVENLRVPTEKPVLVENLKVPIEKVITPPPKVKQKAPETIPPIVKQPMKLLVKYIFC